MIRVILARALAAATAILLASVTLTACVPGFQTSIDVRAGRDVVLTASEDFQIRIPGSAIEGSGKLDVEPIEQHGAPGWAINLDGASLIGEAQLVFEHDLTGDEPAPIAAYNDSLVGPLTFGGETEVADDGVFIVRTTHFSNWFFIAWSDVLKKAGDLLNQTFGPPPGADVQCENTAHAKDLGYVATLSGSTSYNWCMGASGDTAYLKVGNPNGYPVRVEATSHMVLTNPDETLTGLLPQLFSVVTDQPSKAGNTVYLLGGGDSYTFNINSTAPQGLQVHPSGGGYLASSLLFGVETVSLVWGGGSKRTILETMASGAECAVGFATMTQAEIENADAAAEYTSSSIATVFDCLGGTIKKLMGAEGIAAVALVAGVTWLFSGIKTLVDGVAGLGETVFNPAGATVVVENANHVAEFIDVNGEWCFWNDRSECFAVQVPYVGDWGSIQPIDPNDEELHYRPSGDGYTYIVPGHDCFHAGVGPREPDPYGNGGSAFIYCPAGVVEQTQTGYAFENADFDRLYITQQDYLEPFFRAEDFDAAVG